MQECLRGLRGHPSGNLHSLMVELVDKPVLRAFFFSSRGRHTRFDCDWSSDVCSSDLRPEGARVAALVDDPWLLDFSRNSIALLDFPGAAAPAPGLPSFTDAEHWRAYFVAEGIRYVAFSDPAVSTYMYRRSNWVWRLYVDDELHSFLSAHLVDAPHATSQAATKA